MARKRVDKTRWNISFELREVVESALLGDRELRIDDPAIMEEFLKHEDTAVSGTYRKNSSGALAYSNLEKMIRVRRYANKTLGGVYVKSIEVLLDPSLNIHLLYGKRRRFVNPFSI